MQENTKLKYTSSFINMISRILLLGAYARRKMPEYGFYLTRIFPYKDRITES